MTFTFIDLFAGIGGFRQGFESIGGRCIFTAEIDKFAQQTYLANYYNDQDHVMVGDITKINPQLIPDHDILCAGFPCQPFSIAGVSSKNWLGKKHGFEDQTSGTLFFNLAQIIQAKQPKAFLLENVKNLTSHDNGNTFKVIYNTLTELGYTLYCQVIDAKYWVPQHRERLFIVGFRDNLQFNFSRINTNYQPKLNSILDTVVDSKYTLKDGTWNCLQQHKIKHINNNSGFGYNLHTSNDVAKTLTARYAKDGAEILIQQSGNPRRLTPRECARLMGFDDNFKIVVSDTQAYKQFGNSVVPLVIQDIAKEIIKSLKNNQFAPCQLSIPFAS